MTMEEVEAGKRAYKRLLGKSEPVAKILQKDELAGIREQFFIKSGARKKRAEEAEARTGLGVPKKTEPVWTERYQAAIQRIGSKIKEGFSNKFLFAYAKAYADMAKEEGCVECTDKFNNSFWAEFDELDRRFPITTELTAVKLKHLREEMGFG